MNGIVFFEDGTVKFLGQLNSVRMIALKAQEIIPQLLQQERDAILDTMTEQEILRVVERYEKLKDKSDE